MDPKDATIRKTAAGSGAMNALHRLALLMADFKAPGAHIRFSGEISEIRTTAYSVVGLSDHVRLGERVGLETADGFASGEVIRIDRESILVKSYDRLGDVAVGQRVYKIGPLQIAPDPSWRGRVIDAFGQPIDGAGPLAPGSQRRPLDARPPNPVKRSRVDRPLRTGVRVVDLFTPLCAGQRIGIFAGSGVGKSTLLSMLAGGDGFDTVVVALVGERGREVRDMLDEALVRARDKSVVVVATSDESPMRRRLAPATALTVAESFRDLGQKVLLIVDSATRYAHAARDVALAGGEPPVSRGYPPSVFADLPALMERAGPGEGDGSITAVIAVLVDGDDHNDPIADSLRGILDGHIVLDRAIAETGRYPAVNVLKSISRLAPKAWTAEEAKLVAQLRRLIARYEDTRELRLLGGHQPGLDEELDRAIALVPKIVDALGQLPTDPPSKDAFRELARAIG